MQDFTHLKAWQLAHLLAQRLNDSLSPATNYRAPRLRAQALSAADSVSANIAEGCSRRSPVEFRRYLEISLGSLFEVENALGLALHARILRTSAHTDLIRKTVVLRRMLVALLASVERRINDKPD